VSTYISGDLLVFSDAWKYTEAAGIKGPGFSEDN